jgi:glycosyltransferase involved in cell wall biosynthesis
MKASNLDLFHSPHYVLPPIRPCKAVVTIHDIIHILFPEYLPSKYAFWYAKFMLTLAARSSRRIITVSESSKKDIVNYLNVSPEKVVVIPNAIESQFNKIETGGWVKKFREETNLLKPYILYVGSHAPHKNVDGLIRAFSLFKKRTKNPVQLVLAGEERKNSPDIGKLIAEYSLEEDIKFLGSKLYDKNRLPMLYNAAEMFVFPSFYEGFGLPPLEAMACGIPVITSTCSSLPEVVGDAGILIDPRNYEDMSKKMEQLFDDTRLRASLVEKGFERVQHFSAEKTARKTLKVYREVANSG